MDLLSVAIFVGGLLFIYLVPPRWIRKTIKVLLRDSLGAAALDFFSDIPYTDPESGETFVLTPHEAALLFCRDLVSVAATTATQGAMEEAAPFMASLHSEKIAKEMQGKSAAARGFNKLPKGMQGRQAVQRSLHEMAAVVAPKPEGMAAKAMQWNQVAQSFGFDVPAYVAGKMGGKAAATAPAPVVGVP